MMRLLASDKLRLFTIFLTFIVLGYFQSHIKTNVSYPKLKITKENTAYKFNSSLISKFNYGQGRLISSLFWIHTLLESDISHYKGEELESWMYLRFKLISLLDPLFYENYYYGGLYLGVIKNDPLGAIDLLEPSLKIFPRDTKLHLNYGNIQTFDLKNFDRALFAFNKVKSNNDLPPYFHGVLAQVLAKKLTKQDAFNYIQGQLESLPKDTTIYKIRQKQLYAIKAEIDLDCLNSRQSIGKIKCKQRDLYGESYIKKEGQYYAPQTWISFFKINN